MAWNKKYRPACFNEFILPPSKRLRRIIGNWHSTGQITTNKIPLFLGDRGTGKSTLAEFLTRHFNSKTNNGDILVKYEGRSCGKPALDAICGSARWSGSAHMTYVMIDEINRATPEFKAGLRHVYDKYIVDDYLRIIATANEIGDLETIECGSVFDRLLIINYSNLSLDDVVLRCCQILDLEGVSYDPEVVIEICVENERAGKSKVPPVGISLRSCIEECEQRTIGGVLE